jgi:hypothetical protein
MGSKAVMELPPDVIARIEARLASGTSTDPVDVIREGLTSVHGAMDLPAVVAARPASEA